MSASKAAEAGTLAAMLESFDNEVSKDTSVDDAQRLRSLTDFNAGAMAVLLLLEVQQVFGKDPVDLVPELKAEALKIHDGLNPERFRKKI